MKNLHILKTKKPSRLRYYNNSEYILSKGNLLWADSKNIYITSDEEIKVGDWCIDMEEYLDSDPDNYSQCFTYKSVGEDHWDNKKIILTTDQDLIKDGIQAIDDEFLEWFVKNPSCEEVEVKKGKLKFNDDGEEYGFPDMSLYKIIIPKEELTISDEAKQRAKNYMSLKGALEPKQETLEEANWKVLGTKKDTFYNGAKWQAERMYSEADKIMKFLDTEVELKLSDKKTIERIKWYFETYFEQFKKK